MLPEKLLWTFQDEDENAEEEDEGEEEEEEGSEGSDYAAGDKQPWETARRGPTYAGPRRQARWLGKTRDRSRGSAQLLRRQANAQHRNGK